MMKMMERGELDRSKFMKRLDGFLTLELDRKLFDLPVKDERKASEATVKSQPSNH